MTIRTILVFLPDAASARAAMPPAEALARRHGAHLIGLHLMESLVVYPELAMHVPAPAFTDFSASQKKEAEAVEAVFRRITAVEDFVTEWRLIRTETATAADRLLESARAADLVIAAQPPKDARGARERCERLIRDSGRPVLVVPRDGWDKPIGQTALLGWSNTREATRAAHDAFALLKAGAAVHILSVATGSTEAPDYRDSLATASELAQAFDRHGHRAETVTRATRDNSVTEVLTREAFERGADLIVTGALGHSAFYDFVVGAVTRELLETATLPVLFSK
ncbi:universal stress protein [Halovulum dunhuangense]|uniref:Universal stress protein n=1 Tax=Halovulum dunhuangense TaxID=1505036 RepID=A0A849L4U1_9RHOB|nr:universal stress protein [Halovulum dunhuangense]NNU81157.1 universal stress protein [Halovulum dunhuangense]